MATDFRFYLKRLDSINEFRFYKSVRDFLPVLIFFFNNRLGHIALLLLVLRKGPGPTKTVEFQSKEGLLPS